MPSCRESWRRGWTQVSCIAGIFFTIWATREALPKNRGNKHLKKASQVALVSGKEPACQCRRCKRHKFNPWVRKIPWRRVWQPTLVLLPGECHRQRSLAGYGPEDHKELDPTLETWHARNHNQDWQPMCHCVCLFSQLCLTLCNPPAKAPLSMEFSRQEYWTR